MNEYIKRFLIGFLQLFAASFVLVTIDLKADKFANSVMIALTLFNIIKGTIHIVKASN